jgi:cytochrome c oxidase cbb3-type subunit 4
MLTTLQIIWTMLSLLIFIGIVFWAWSRKRKDRFQAAALEPLHDDALSGNGTDG